MVKHFRFADEVEAMAKLHEAGYLVQDTVWSEEQGEWIADGDPHLPHNNKGKGFDIVVLGTLPDMSNPIVVQDPDYGELKSYPPLAGWHIDIVTRVVPEVLEPYLVQPKNPRHCI